MPILHQGHVQSFALHPFRTVIDRPACAKTFKETLARLSQYYGDFLHVHQCHESDQYHIACSHEDDLLLGETIWQHLNQPQDLIYCEALPYQKQFLVVIIIDGHVFLDTKIHACHLAEELIPVLDLKQDFQVVLSGSMPRNMLTSPCSLFQHQVHSIEPITQALSKKTYSSHYQLRPLQEVLAQSRRFRPLRWLKSFWVKPYWSAMLSCLSIVSIVGPTPSSPAINVSSAYFSASQIERAHDCLDGIVHFSL